MRTLGYFYWTAVIISTIVVPARAQQQQSQEPSSQQAPQQPLNPASQPIPAYRSPLIVGDTGSAQDANADPNALSEDVRSLAGAQDLSLGALRIAHTFWAPYLQLSSTLDSNPQTTSGSPGWTTWTTIYGGLDLNRISDNSDLVLSYLGGGAISNDGGSSFELQQLGVNEQLTFHRARIAFLDQFGYLPEANFGYAGVAGPNLQTSGNLGLQSGFAPNQSILTSLGQRISNTFITQADAILTPRSSLTFVGSYGRLDFIDNNLNNNYEAIGQVGYNYRLTRKDTIAVLYRFDAFRYDHIAQSINDHSVQLSYARRVTGRLAFQVLGGPDVAFSLTPISTTSGTSAGTSAGTSGPTAKTRQFFWHLSSNVTYQLRRTSLGASYFHGVTGGSGVLAGAVTDNVSGSASRALSRTVQVGLSAGYARNTGVAITPTSQSTLLVGQTYNFWFTGVNFSRSLGRSANLVVGYQANYENSNSSFCVTATCSTTYIQHQISLTLGWNPRGSNARAATF